MALVVGMQTAILVARYRRLNNSNYGTSVDALNDALQAPVGPDEVESAPTPIIVRVYLGDSLLEGHRVVHTRTNPPTIEFRILISTYEQIPIEANGALYVHIAAQGIRKLGFGKELLRPSVAKLTDHAASIMSPYSERLASVFSSTKPT